MKTSCVPNHSGQRREGHTERVGGTHREKWSSPLEASTVGRGGKEGPSGGVVLVLTNHCVPASRAPSTVTTLSAAQRFKKCNLDS